MERKPIIGNQKLQLYVVNQKVTPQKNPVPVSQLKPTDSRRFDFSSIIKKGTSDTQAKNAVLSLNEKTRRTADKTARRTF